MTLNRELWEDSGATRVSVRRVKRRNKLRTALIQGYWNYAQRNTFPDLENIGNPMIAPQDFEIHQSGRVLELWNKDLSIRPPDLSWHSSILVTTRELSFKITVEGHLRSLKPRTKSGSRSFRKIETKSGTQPDGSSHLGPGLFNPHPLLHKNGVQTKRVSVLTGNQLIGEAQIKHAGIRHDSRISLDSEIISIDPLNKGIHGDETKSVCDDDYFSPLLLLALLMWHVRLLSLVFLCHKHEILSCFFVKILFQWHRLMIKIVCARWAWLTNVRQVTVGRPWEFPCIHSSYWLELSVSILNRKESYIFVGSCPVSVVSSQGTIHTERTLSHSQLDVESTPHFEMMNFQNPSGWIRGDTKNGLVLEVVINYHQGKPRIEIRIDFFQEMDLNRGSEFRTDLTYSWKIWQKRHEILVKLWEFQKHRAACRSRIENCRIFSTGSRQTKGEGETEAEFCGTDLDS